MKDCRQFNETLHFFYPQEENLRFLDHYFPNYNFENKKVLDAGCRNGGLTNSISLKGAKVTGVDLNKKAIEFARSLFKGPEFINGNILDLNIFENNYFDLIICTGTLPYLNSPEKVIAIDNFKRVLRPGGKNSFGFSKE